MIGKVHNTITVQKLYDYALKHNYLNTDVKVVLDIIDRDATLLYHNSNLNNNNNLRNSLPASNVGKSSTTYFDNLVEYTIEDLLTLLNS